VNANLTDDQKRLWLRVQSAYEAGDLAELRALALLAEKFGSLASPAKSLEKLRQDQQTLEKQIAEMLKRIEQIESQPPFTLRGELEDMAWVAARRTEIEKQITQLQTQRDALDAHLHGLLTGKDYGQQFGKN
jgi:chromosome segregation ATPase